MKLSACYIAKNEEKNIARSLESMIKIADELILVDTGSDDGTKEIFKSHGGKVYEQPWQGDFSLHRNYALSKATGDWIIFLDADEYFEYPDKVKNTIEKIITANSKVNSIFVPLANIDTSNNKVIHSNNAIRIFKNNIGIKYVGHIHEFLSINGHDDAGLVYGYLDNSMQVIHTGYSKTIIREKLVRNLELILQEIQHTGNLDRYYYYLADCYLGLGMYDLALDNALCAIKSDYQPIGQQGDMYWVALEAMDVLKVSVHDKLDLINRAIKAVPEIPDFWGYKGIVLCEADEHEESLELLYKSIELYKENAKNEIHYQSSHYEQLLPRIQCCLGRVLSIQGELGTARDYYKTVLGDNKWDTDALFGYIDTYTDFSDDELDGYINQQYLSTQADKDIFIRILCEEGLYFLANKYSDGNFEYSNYVGAYLEDNQLLLHDINKDIAFNLQELFVALLGNEINYADYSTRQQISVLPAALQDIVLYYHGISTEKTVDYSSYMSMFNAVLSMGNISIISRYLGMAVNFTEEQAQDILGSIPVYMKIELGLDVE